MGSHASGAPEKLKRKEYERELRKLHAELVALQEWVLSQMDLDSYTADIDLEPYTVPTIF